jgi:AraC-like DNA-binding protein
MPADPLSQILELLDARCLVTGGLAAGGSWARRFPQPDAVKFMALAEGECWLVMEELPGPPLHLETGDVIVVNGKRALALVSDPALVPPPEPGPYDHSADGIGYLGDGRDFYMLGGHVAVDPARQNLLLEVLPPLIHIRNASPEAAALRWLLDQLVRERAAARPGAEVAIAQLAQLLFVQALRAHLAGGGPAARGWLKALGDERIAPALCLMHGDPARPWELGELARAVAMSRTGFAARFKAVVGTAPLAYLIGWRMQLAERDLRRSDVPVSTLARTLGYSSESAFSNAFKRTMGVAPKRYRTSFRAAALLAA